MPDNPEAWLITTARNHLSNQSRHQNVTLAATDELLRRADEQTDPAPLP